MASSGISHHAIAVVFGPDGKSIAGSVTTYDLDGTYRVTVIQPGPFDTPDDLWRQGFDALDTQLTLWDNAS